MNPLVSVIITTYGGGEHLERAVESVLAQDYPEYEIIVVDDNNPDTQQRKKTENIMKKFVSDEKVKYLKHEKNKNGAAARNTGIQKAKGEYIAFLDDDDYYISDRLSVILKTMEKDKTIDGICTGVAFVKNSMVSELMQIKNKILQYSDLIENNMVLGTGSNIFVKTEIVKQLNGFDENFLRLQDVEFMLRVSKIAKISYIDDLLVVKETKNNFMPKFANVYKAYEIFENKFDNDIKSLPEKLQKKYYTEKLMILYRLAYNTDKNAVKKVDCFADKLDKDGILSASEKFSSVFFIKLKIKENLKKTFFYTKFKNIQLKKNNDFIKQNMSSELYNKIIHKQ